MSGSATAAEVRVFALDALQADHWLLFPEVLRRVGLFGLVDGHGAPHTMSEAMRQWTAVARRERPGARVWVAVAAGVVVGHLVAEIARESDLLFANVAQYQVDRGFAWSEAQRRLVLREIVAWAETFGVSEVRCTVRHPALARAFRTLGFVDTGRRVLVLEGGEA
ncbi:MAG TPA: hypothetical protein PKL08_16155 [Thermoanaerobaculaceae bacterium]|nr:hypothetical protein [Thermoanaerobaculaceae bacterium]